MACSSGSNEGGFILFPFHHFTALSVCTPLRPLELKVVSFDMHSRPMPKGFICPDSRPMAVEQQYGEDCPLCSDFLRAVVPEGLGC